MQFVLNYTLIKKKKKFSKPFRQMTSQVKKYKQWIGLKIQKILRYYVKFL